MKAKFFILCDVIFLQRLQEKCDIDRLLGVKGLNAAAAISNYFAASSFSVRCLRRSPMSECGCA